jgi:hypothetical protein
VCKNLENERDRRDFLTDLKQRKISSWIGSTVLRNWLQIHTGGVGLGLGAVEGQMLCVCPEKPP